MKVLSSVFSDEELIYLQNLPEVLTAQEKLSQQTNVYFSIPALDLIKTRLHDHFDINLDSLTSIPCRWIKGDTPGHIDRGHEFFHDTYLVYLTDGEGQFTIHESSYPIEAGTGFSFSEGLSHEVTGTNGTSRLLLGPMSESGFAVGASVTLSGDGATDTIYISQDDSTKYYRINDGELIQITGSPIYIQNTNSTPASNILKVIFTTSLTMNDIYSYFTAYSDGIQFGSTSIDTLGQKRQITINGVTDYPGLIQNGEAGTAGKNSISVYNLFVSASESTLASGGGWIGQSYFGNDTTNNYILNCSSDGAINGGGGILGNYAENVTLIGCSSSGEIQLAGGGIVGQEVSSVVIQMCWSTGVISTSSGGIIGSNSVSAEISKCYSEGAISGNNTGGIVAGNAGITSVTITGCYSRGAITGANAGGICGSLAPDSGTFTVTITNCYSTGNLDNTVVKASGAICGPLNPYNTGEINLTISNCYTTGTVVESKGYMIGNITTINGSQLTNPIYVLTNNFSEAGSSGGSSGSWNSTNADTALTGEPTSTPGVGSTWATTASNTAYELANFGKTPYQVLVIQNNALVQSTSQTVTQGTSSIEALAADASGNAFSILAKTGGNSESYDTITINAQTGAVLTRNDTSIGTYTLTVRSTGSYNITQFILTVTLPSYSNTAACCVTTIGERGLAYEQINNYRIGNTLLAEHSANTAMKFNDYAEYVRFKMAQGSAKY